MSTTLAPGVFRLHQPRPYRELTAQDVAEKCFWVLVAWQLISFLLRRLSTISRSENHRLIKLRI